MSRLRDTPVGPVHHGPGRPRRVPHNVPVHGTRPTGAGRPWSSRSSPSSCWPSRSGWTSARPRRDPASSWPTGFGWPYAAIGLVFGLCCAVVLVHDPRQGFGWALGGIAIFWGLDGLAQSYVRYGIRADDALPGVNAALWFLNRFGAFLPMTVAVLLAIFPTGRFLAGVWGRITQVALVAMAASGRSSSSRRSTAGRATSRCRRVSTWTRGRCPCRRRSSTSPSPSPPRRPSSACSPRWPAWSSGTGGRAGSSATGCAGSCGRSS